MNAHRIKGWAAAVFIYLSTALGWAAQPDSRPDIRYYFKTLDIQNGLSQNTVNAILQDRSGFMWFGTKDGLNRFDGLSFRVFRKEADALGNNFITALHEDGEGKLWVGTDAGVYVYDPFTETFSDFPLVPAGADKPQRAVTMIGSDAAGRIWISMDYNGLFCYDRSTGELRNLLPSGPAAGKGSGPGKRTDTDGSEKGKETVGLEKEAETESPEKETATEGLGKGKKGEGPNKETETESSEKGKETEGPDDGREAGSPPWRPNVTRFWFDGAAVWVSLYDDNLYVTTDTFRTLVPFRAADGSEPFRGDIINSQAEGPHNCWYIGSANGLTEINRVTGRVRRLLDGYVRDLCFQSDGELWVGTEAGLYICDLSAGSFRRTTGKGTSQETFERPDPAGRVTSGAALKTGDPGSYATLQAAAANQRPEPGAPRREAAANAGRGLCFTHLTAAEDNDPYALADNAIYALTRDREGGMWIGSYFGGVNYYPRQWAYFEKFYPRDDLRHFGRRVREFAEGEDGIIWIGTEDKGLFRFDPASGSIEPFLAGEIYHNIHGLCVDGPYLWVGTFSDGLHRVDLRTGRHRHYRRAGQKGGSSHRASVENAASGGVSLPGGAPGKASFSGAFGKETSSLGAFGKELSFPGAFGEEASFSPALGREASSSSSAHASSSLARASASSQGFIDANDVFSICKTSAGELLAGTTSGLFRYDRAADCFRRVSYPGNVFVYDVLEDRRGNIWLATYSNGLYRYDVARKLWKNFRSHPADTTSLPYDKVISLFEDSRGRLWIMTEGGGFCRFDAEREHFVRYRRSEGFSNPVVYRMVEDDAGHLWLTTNHGLVCFHPETARERVYTTADGLLSNQFNYQSGLKDRRGRLYLGSINGFITFDPATFSENRFVPPVVLADFFLFNRRAGVGNEDSPLEKSIVYADRIELDADQNAFSLHAAALSYQAPEMNRLRYKLEGLDKEWYAVGPSGAVNYSNLPYGRYTFRLKGSNSDGRWNETERRLEIRIRPPFYLSGWARAVYVLLALGCVAGTVAYFRRRSALRQRRAMERFEREKERELYTAKIDFFTNVAHEIRTPLTLIKSPLENVLASRAVGVEVRDDLEIMSLNTQRLLDLVNQLLDFRRTETRGLRLRFARVDVSALLQQTFLRFTLSARQRGLRFTLEKTDGVEAEADREALTKVMSNLFSNAVKYAATYIRVRLSAGDGRLRLSVCNDGTPVPREMREEIFKPFIQYTAEDAPKAPGTGIGLALARSLTELHGGTLCMGEAEEENCFVLSLPLLRGGAVAGGTAAGLGTAGGGVVSEGGISEGDGALTGVVSEGKISEGDGALTGVVSEGEISGGDDALTSVVSEGGISEGDGALTGGVSQGEISGRGISGKDASRHAVAAGGLALPKPPRYAVLVVEDNPEMQAFVARQLSPLYEVWKAADGAEALEVLAAHPVNLVVSDVMMPRMDGLELCDRIKETLEFSHIPVVLLTAKTTLQAKIDGLKSGADAYVEKPFSVEYLKVCVANLLSGREKLRAAFAHSPLVATPAMALTKADEAFLRSLAEVVRENMENPDFCLDDMAAALCMSRSSLNRKIKGALDLTPNDYIRLERLKKAAELLREGTCKVNEVCYRVGFNTPSYFTKCFQKQFGILPKEFVR